MGTQQLILSLVLATMVFSVALEVKPDDFRRVMQTPKTVLCGFDRATDKLPLAQAVEMMTRRNARYIRLKDRGVIAVGLRAGRRQRG